MEKNSRNYITGIIKNILIIIGEFVIGRVIKAMGASWHADCFGCADCGTLLADAGFVRYLNRALCHTCNARARAAQMNTYMCHKCQYVRIIHCNRDNLRF